MVEVVVVALVSDGNIKKGGEGSRGMRSWREGVDDQMASFTVTSFLQSSHNQATTLFAKPSKVFTDAYR